MGDNADLINEGVVDAITGEFIGDAVGYPRTLDRSLPWEQKSLSYKHLNGIYKVLAKRGMDGGNHRKNYVIHAYAHNELDLKDGNTEEIAEIIQSDFSRFIIWLNKQ